MTVSGKGALSSWKGSIKGALDGQNVADLALTLGGTGKDQRLGIDGALNPGFLITDAAVDQVVGTLNLDVDVAMRKGLPQSYVAVIGAPAAAITLSGGLRTDADLMAARFNITSRDAGALSPLLGEWSVGSFTLEGQLPGAEADKTQIRFSIRDASGPGVTGLNLGGEAALETRDGGKAKAPTLHIEGAGTVGLLSPAPLDGAWAVTARYEADQVVLERLSISDAQTQLVVGGEVALSPLDVALEVDAKVADLTQWRSLSGLDLTGAMHAKGPVAWRESDVLPRVNLTLVAKNTGFGDDGINEILGASQSLHLITKAASGENGPETGVDIQFSGGILVFDLGGRVDSGTETIAADFNAHLQNPGTVSVLAGMGLSDNVTLSGTLTGAMENPSLVAQINVPQIAQGPITLDDLALNVTADNLGTVPAGRVALKTRLGDADVLGNLTFAVTDNGGWRLDDILLEGDALNLSGSISAADSGAPAVGALQMTLPRGNLLSTLTGTSVMASISGNVELLADGNDQQISVSLDAENLQYSPADQPRTTARTATIEGLITLKNQVELNRFEMRASDIRSADASVATLSFLATPEGEGLDLKISADGRLI